jgi:hypothetical protein
MRQQSRAFAISSPARRRRRGSDTEPLKKVTLQIRASVFQAVRALVDEGATPSTNVFVEEALDQRLREIRRERVYREYQEAANDALFMADMASTTQAFESTTGDGLVPPSRGARLDH